MLSRRLILFGLRMIVASSGIPTSAQGEGIVFTVPEGTAVYGEQGYGDSVGIFTGRPLGVIAAGTCGEGDANPVQNVIFVHPQAGRSTFASVIVVSTSEPLPAGTRTENIEGLGNCAGPGGAVHDMYRAIVQ